MKFSWKITTPILGSARSARDARKKRVPFIRSELAEAEPEGAGNRRGQHNTPIIFWWIIVGI